ncbi:MAG: hypothetical protein ACJAZ2_002293, partial [Glaciecola sp.]
MKKLLLLLTLFTCLHSNGKDLSVYFEK